VAVVVPFAGSAAELRALLERMRSLKREPGDQVIVADNRLAGQPREHEGIRVVPALGLPTPAFARNRGAQYADSEWLLFLDADTEPAPGLLEGFFQPAPGPRTAVLAGAINDAAPLQARLVARYAAAREHLGGRTTLDRAWSYAQTANCAVLRRAFVQIGGFAERARAGEDADLCFRLAAAGWELEERPNAVVRHLPRSSIGALLVQLVLHGSGAAWANRRFPGSFPVPAPRTLVRRLAHGAREAIGALTRGNPQAAAFALLDLLGAAAFELGRLLPNERKARACAEVREGTHG
jgi:hypothetical protein